MGSALAAPPRRRTTRPPTTVAAWEAFCAAVLSGERVVGKLVRLAVERHRRDLAEGGARGLTFDVEAAQHAIDFFGFLRHSKGEWAGQTFALADWQAFLVAMLFGWKRADGFRRFRVSYTELPRKSGKSTLAAGILLYLFFADGEPGAETYTAATKRDQARIVHEECVRMVKASPLLRSRIRAFRDNLNVERTNSKCEPLGADEDTMDGLNVHGVVIDEYHAHKNTGVFDKLMTATGARRQPLIFCITTAGSQKATSPCGQQHEYSVSVLHGTVLDDQTFVFIAALDPGDDWRDETCWGKANLNLGVSNKLDDLQRKATRAKELPSAQNSFRRLHLNEWTEQDERWLDLALWDACAGPIPADELRDGMDGRTCFAGMDLASIGDLTAIVLYFPPEDDDDPGVLVPWFWVPRANIQQRVRKDRVPYDVWVDQEWIEATEGDVTDYDVIRERYSELASRYVIHATAYDRWNASQLVTQLTSDGAVMVPFGQGFKDMSPATKEFERLLSSRRIVHGGHPVLRWMAQNVTITRDPADNMKPNKQKSGEKIDGLVAAIMAVGWCARTDTDEGASVYDTADLKWLE